MKKLLLLSAVLLGAATASQAGVRFNLRFGIPLPPPFVVAPAYVQPAPAYVQPAPECAVPAPAYVAPPVCDAPVVVVGAPVIRFGFRDHVPYWHHFRDGYRHRW